MNNSLHFWSLFYCTKVSLLIIKQSFLVRSETKQRSKPMIYTFHFKQIHVHPNYISLHVVSSNIPEHGFRKNQRTCSIIVYHQGHQVIRREQSWSRTHQNKGIVITSKIVSVIFLQCCRLWRNNERQEKLWDSFCFGLKKNVNSTPTHRGMLVYKSWQSK